MNEYQVMRQVRFILNAAVWPGGSEVVFGGVAVKPVDPLSASFSTFQFPLAAIRPMAGQIDPEKNEQFDLLRATFEVRLYVDNQHNRSGSSLLGANRSGPSASAGSDGRGLLEVQERIIDELGKLTGTDGVKIINTMRSDTGSSEVEGLPAVVFRDYLFEVLTANDRFYHPPTRLTAVDAGGGDVDLTWKKPPTRFDTVNVMIRRTVGTTPPTGPTDGTLVVNSTVTTFTDSPGSGTFSYAAFGAYDENSETPVNQDIFSDGDDVTVTVA